MGEKDSPGDSITESGLSSSTTSSSKYSSSSDGSKEYCVSSAGPKGWPLPKPPPPTAAKDKPQFSKEDERIKLRKLGSRVSDVEMMRERFAKLLLGEDMSGGGRGVCPALAISNAVTNLCATVFGQLWTLAPLPNEKKLMWRKELDCLLSVGDHIVELVPSVQTLADGTKLEIMTSRPRSDILMDLPALRKLDLLLLEILDSFAHKTEFWYVDQDLEAPDADGSASFRQTIQRQEEKWWLPVPRLHACGLLEDTRKKLVHKRECAAQILKAAMAINNSALAEMEVPDSYIETLPKNGRSCLGEVIYRYITSDHFSSDCLLDCLDLSSEHVALDIANRVEASIYVWRSRLRPRNHLHPTRSTAKSSWEMVKDFVIDGDRARALLAERAENLLLSLKQRFPGLSQTTLDASKIQCNKDVGKSILESYSRVLESLAFNIVARIDDLLYVDDLTKQSDNLSSSTPRVSIIAQRKVGNPYSVPLSGTPCGTAFTTPNFSPAPHASSPREDTTPLITNGGKLSRRGMGVKRVLTNYLGTEVKVKNCGVLLEGLGSVSQKSSDLNVCETKQVSAWK